MPDYGARKADKAIQRVERELRSTYGTAKRELQEKLRDFNDKYRVKDAAKRKQLAEGKITKQDYANWKAGQVFQRKQWESKVREVTQVLAHTNEQAMRVVNDSRLDVFAENYNFSAFLGEQQLGVSFDVYNTQAVARLIKDDHQILPEWKIDEEKDYEWNAKKVNNIVQQGIIQGEGIPEITKRLCSDLATQNENKMRMFARTAITGAQNAGRQQQMEDAAEMGIQVEKQWIATLDSRTRDWHRDRDGETVPYNEEFSGGLEYPGDPAGDPADVYNCRCTMITVYPEHAAHHDEGARRAYAEYEDEDGEHRKGYVTENPNVYEGWSEKAYRRWLERKQEQNKIAQPEPENKNESDYEKMLKQMKQKIEAIKSEKGNYDTWNLEELQSVGEDFAKAIEEHEKYATDRIEEIHDEKAVIKAEQDKLLDIYDKFYAGKASKAERDEADKQMSVLLDRKSELDKELRELNSGRNAHTVLKDIRSCGGVTDKNIGEFVDLKYYNESKHTARVAKEALNMYPTQWLKESSEYYMSLKPHWTEERAYYSTGNGEIRFCGRKATNVHELGHRFEHVIYKIKTSEREFYAKRTKGEELKWLGPGYKESEKTRKDHFLDSYMGKDYGGSSFELVSMGFQYAFTDYDRLCKDKDMQTWILGILASL